MKRLSCLIKNNAKNILHIFITCILCIVFVLFYNRFAEYLLFINILLSIGLVYCLYRIIFKKKFLDSILKIFCILFLFIAANQLYSHDKLINFIPWIKSIKQEWIIPGFIAIFILIFILLKLLSYIDTPNKMVNQEENNNDLRTNDNSIETNTTDSKIRLISVLQFLGFFIGFIIVLLIPVVLLYLFNKYGIDSSALDFDKVVSFLISYGSAFLLILFALVIVVITLIHITKYIFRILTKSNDKDTENEIPTYAFSVVIVCVLLFLARKVTDFNLESLTNELLIGDYLALPISIIVIITLFFLLVQITHSIILFLKTITTTSIINFFKKQDEVLKITKQIKDLIIIIFEIILGTILSVVTFVKFVPDFFGSLSKMVLDEDESNDSDEKDVQCENEKNDENKNLS